jgi:hypothetical protein
LEMVGWQKIDGRKKLKEPSGEIVTCTVLGWSAWDGLSTSVLCC